MQHVIGYFLDLQGLVLPNSSAAKSLPPAGEMRTCKVTVMKWGGYLRRALRLTAKTISMNKMIEFMTTSPAHRWARYAGAAVFVLAGCDGVSGPASEANARVSMQMPAMLSRAVDASQVTVDVQVNGVEIDMTREGEQFIGTVLLPAGSEPLVSIIWYEFFSDQRLRLAEFEKRLQSLESNMTLAIDETMYETADIDADSDAISNLEERIEGTDPFDPADPGPSNNDSPTTTISAPSNLQAIAQSLSNVVLDWHDNTENETLYRVQWRLEDDEVGWQNSPSGGSLPAGTTTHTISGLSSGSYVFRVFALVDDEPHFSDDLNVEMADGNSEIDVFGDPFLSQMMTTESDTDPLPVFNDTWWAANQAQTELSSIESLIAATSEGRGDILSFEAGADLILSRIWANRRADHDAPQSELQVTGLYAEVLDKRDEQWKRVWGPLTIGGANQWAEDWLGQDSDSLARGSNMAGGPIAAFSNGLDEAGQAAPQTGFPWSVEDQVNADLVQNAKLYRVRGLVRVAMRPAATADDRSNARFLIQQNFALLNSAHPAYPYDDLTAGSEFTRPNDTYPGSSVFGGRGRWYLVPFQPDYPEKWYAFGVISVTDSVWYAKIGKPWSDAMGCGEWVCDSPHAAIGGLSSAQYELSSPPAIGF